MADKLFTRDEYGFESQPAGDISEGRESNVFASLRTGDLTLGDSTEAA